jgi:hypothetical protein
MAREMTTKAEKGTWVEVEEIVLQPGSRAMQVPEDTQRMPLELKVKGFLTDAASIGDQAEIITTTGRCVSGTLAAINPGYAHLFGPAVPELVAIGNELRAIMRDLKS